MVPTIRLAPRLVPRPLWGRSAARLLDDEEWRAIRATVVTAADSSCAVCGHRQRRWMVCDEDWRYELLDPGTPDERGVARLVDLRLLCPRCDRVVHLGHTETRHGRDGADDALAHAARVNGIGVEDARLLAEAAFEAWARLSSIQRWRVEVAPALAARHPRLRVVEDEAAAG